MAEPNVDEIVIGEVGIPPSRMLTSVASEDGALRPTGAGAMWQVRDSSDSGCRIRGRAAELRWLLPGSLMAFRDSEDSPWRLGVVRRLRKILGTNVEIGVERLSVDPQRVVLDRRRRARTRRRKGSQGGTHDRVLPARKRGVPAHSDQDAAAAGE